MLLPIFCLTLPPIPTYVNCLFGFNMIYNLALVKLKVYALKDNPFYVFNY